MKNRVYYFAFILVLVFFSCNNPSNTSNPSDFSGPMGTMFYVDEYGSDSNKGTSPETAVATLNKALSLIRTAYADTTYPWPDKDTNPETAHIFISGRITEDSFEPSSHGMVFIYQFYFPGGELYPPIELGGLSVEKPGIIDAQGKKRVLYMGYNKVTLTHFLTLTGGVSSYGAGVFAEDHCNFTMDGGSIEYNTASESGGGVYIGGSNFTMKNGNISNNTASAGGGVITGSDIYSGRSVFNMEGGSIVNNIIKIKDQYSYGAGVHITAHNGYSGVSNFITSYFSKTGSSIISNNSVVNSANVPQQNRGNAVYIDFRTNWTTPPSGTTRRREINAEEEQNLSANFTGNNWTFSGSWAN